jgi:YidC/Oxa1 family membrane protein insertase
VPNLGPLHILSIGAWPLVLGVTMFLQQKMNPPPPDPVQAKIFMFLPIMFTFMMAQFQAGLVIYWSWNNLLGIAQQWLLKRLDARRDKQGPKPPVQKPEKQLEQKPQKRLGRKSGKRN